MGSLMQDWAFLRILRMDDDDCREMYIYTISLKICKKVMYLYMRDGNYCTGRKLLSLTLEKGAPVNLEIGGRVPVRACAGATPRFPEKVAVFVE